MSLDTIITNLRERANKFEKNRSIYYNFLEALKKRFPDYIFSDYSLLEDGLCLKAYATKPEPKNTCIPDQMISFNMEYEAGKEERMEVITIMDSSFEEVVCGYKEVIAATTKGNIPEILKKYWDFPDALKKEFPGIAESNYDIEDGELALRVYTRDVILETIAASRKEAFAKYYSFACCFFGKQDQELHLLLYPYTP